MFEIQVKYGEIESRKVLIKTFNSFEELGVWIANNYYSCKGGTYVNRENINRRDK